MADSASNGRREGQFMSIAVSVRDADAGAPIPHFWTADSCSIHVSQGFRIAVQFADVENSDRSTTTSQ